MRIDEQNFAVHVPRTLTVWRWGAACWGWAVCVWGGGGGGGGGEVAVGIHLSIPQQQLVVEAAHCKNVVQFSLPVTTAVISTPRPITLLKFKVQCCFTSTC